MPLLVAKQREQCARPLQCVSAYLASLCTGVVFVRLRRVMQRVEQCILLQGCIASCWIGAKYTDLSWWAGCGGIHVHC